MKNPDTDNSIEWKLNPKIFLDITSKYSIPEIDLFASHLNKQLNTYVSWQPEPEAFAINAFSLS